MFAFVTARQGRRKPEKDSDDDGPDEPSDDESQQQQPQKGNLFKNTKEENDRINRQIGIKPFLIMGGIIILLIGLVIGAYYLYDAIINKKILLSCPDFNKKGAGIIPGYCGTGRQYYESTCVKSCPDGFNHTASCTCKKGLVVTDCDIYGKEITIPSICVAGMDYYGATCVRGCPPNWKRTAACTCETGEVTTDCENYGKSHSPTKCPAGRQFYGGMCYLACPDDWDRTAACTCKTGSTVTDCQLYGSSYIPTGCPAGRELYGSACYDPCPSGQTRSAACTCTGGDTVTDCGAYGYQQGYLCKEGKVNVGGLCFIDCPYGGHRTGICSCEYGGQQTPATTSPSFSCPPDYIFRIAPNCYKAQGVLTSCELFDAGTGSTPDVCPSGKVWVGGSCYDPCPEYDLQTGIRIDYRTCQYPDTQPKECVANSGTDASSCNGAYGLYDPVGVGYCCKPYGLLDFQCPGGSICSDIQPATCQSTLDNFAGTCYTKCPNGGYRATPSCTCDFGGVEDGTAELVSCPSAYPLYYLSSCHATEGIQTNCEALSGGPPTIPDSCPSYQESYASACYGKCNPGFARSSLCTCTNFGYATNCSLYGNAKIVGHPLGPQCNLGDDLFAGLCYRGPCPGEQSRTAPCTCSDERVETNCELYGDGKPIGDPLGPQCEEGEELFGSLCYPKCPEGSARTASCTCSSFKYETNCTLYGDPKPLGDPLGPICKYDEEYFGGLCHKQKCPGHMARTAACTCSNEEIVTDCDQHGDAIAIGDPSGNGPKCFPDYDESGGLCYQDKCPDGYFRTGACSCQKNE